MSNSNAKDFCERCASQDFIFFKNIEVKDYEGDHISGAYHGKGKLYFHDGSIYEGDFINNQILGHGIYTSPDGEYYNGTWRYGFFEGFGEYRSEDIEEGCLQGRWTAGHFVENMQIYNINDMEMNMFGKLLIHSGWDNLCSICAQNESFVIDASSVEKYKGEVVLDIYHGLGSIIFKDGSLFRGQLINNRMLGFGAYKDAENNQFMGWFKYGKLNGPGICKSYGGEMKHGFWVNGKLLHGLDYQLPFELKSIFKFV